MINRHVRLLKEMDRGWFLLPFTGLHAAETAAERVIEHGATVEAVVGLDVADTSRSNPNYASSVAETTATGRTETFVYDGDRPFALNCIDDALQIIPAEDDGPRALVETDSEVVVGWAKAKYERCKREATELSLS